MEHSTINFFGLLLIFLAHFLCGRGVLSLLKVKTDVVASVCLSFIIGVPVISIAPCLVQLIRVPITETSVGVAIVLLSLSCSIPLLLRPVRPSFVGLKMMRIYELPFFAMCGALMLFSIWRCYYFPPFSRDMLSGPELVAEFTIREKTMINSVYSVDLSTSNNYFKSPYITGLQIVYKLFVFSFGQLWLSLLFVSFFTWLYTIIIKYVHPIITWVLLLLFLCAPELFAYSFLMLYDYSNMIFFFGGFYFLSLYLIRNDRQHFIVAAFLFGLATYIRTETLVLVAMILPLLVFFMLKAKANALTVARAVGRFFLVPLLFYFVCIHVFVKLFVPIPLNLGGLVNSDLGNLGLLIDRIKGMNDELVFSEHGVGLWGFLVYVFITVLVADAVFVRKFNRMAILSLYGVLVVYFGLAFLGYLLPNVDLENTTKRGLFKAMPLMLLYMANSGVLVGLSGKLFDWEYGNDNSNVIQS